MTLNFAPGLVVLLRNTADNKALIRSTTRNSMKLIKAIIALPLLAALTSHALTPEIEDQIQDRLYQSLHDTKLELTNEVDQIMQECKASSKCEKTADVVLKTIEEMFLYNKNKYEIESAVAQFKNQYLSSTQRLQLLSIKREHISSRSSDPALFEKLGERMRTRSLSQIELQKIFFLSEDRYDAELMGLIKKHYYKEYQEFQNYQIHITSTPTEQQVKDLLRKTPSYSRYKNGHYANGIKIFMFCREKRKYPCMKVMKDRKGNFVKLKNGKYWSQPSLALSRWGRKYHQSNGNTPTGVFRIDGVMPSANKKHIFGKYRRLILNFVSKSSRERSIKALLPASSHQAGWWKQNIVARDNGRNLFRIHGTGFKNENEYSDYHTFVPTSGCVSEREGDYEYDSFQDQKDLLNVAMKAQGLSVKYKNHRKIKGLLYVVNLDNKRGAVTLKDLAPYLP